MMGTAGGGGITCPSCRTENKGGRRFCGHCGSALAQPCASCGYANDPGDVFCGGCGERLGQEAGSGGGTAGTRRIKPAAPLTPPPIHEGFEAARRHLTVVFCDMVGSTEIAEALDPEDWSELLTVCRGACADVVRRYGGHVGRFVGDGILIYFGYPTAHEDDAQRAIRAALALVAAFEKLNETQPLPVGRLALRVGVNTGLVVAGDIGGGDERERMGIVGETPHVAARLQALAQPGGVVIGSNTYRLVEGLFDCNHMGSYALKGIGEPVDVYEVRGMGSARTEFEARMERGLTPLVGRQDEMSVLNSRWQRVLEGAGQTVLVSSAPGHGKSRLIQSFRELARDSGATAIRYLCSPYHSDTPFHPVADRLARAIGRLPTVEGDGTRARLATYLSGLRLDPAREGPPLAALVGVLERGDPDSPDGRFSQLAPDARKRETLKALVATTLAHAAAAPLLLIVEDLQWADPSTLEYLNLLQDEMTQARVMLVCTHRPEFDAPWTDEPETTMVHLKRLTTRESEALAVAVAGGKQLPREVLDHVLSRADGVPLFIEELTKAMLEAVPMELKGESYELTGSISETIIPHTLQDTLLARLDRLGPGKELAQLAAAVGRSFTRDLLAAVSPMSLDELDRGLDRLVQADLLYRRGLAPDVRYEFKHALLQDAAYNSLLRSRRRALHADIARIIEQGFPEMVSEEPEVLARHFQEAGEHAKAIPYALSAGDAAAARFARAEATAHYQSALDMAERLADGPDAARSQIEAVTRLASVAANRSQFERDLANLARARHLAEELGDDAELCRLIYWSGRTHYVLGHFDAAAGAAAEALELAERLDEGDGTYTAGPTNLVARVACLQGEPLKGIEYATRNREQMRRAGDRVEEAAIGGVLSFALAQNGRFSEALRAADEAVRLADELRHPPTVAACYMFRGVVHGWAGDPSPAQSNFGHALSICERAGDLFRAYVVHGWSGEAHLIAGDSAAAVESLQSCLDIGERIGTMFHHGAFEALLAQAEYEASPAPERTVDAAFKRAERAVARSRTAGEQWALSIALRVLGWLELCKPSPDFAAAEAAVREAEASQDSRQCRCDLAWTKLTLGRILAADGRTRDALAALSEARKSFEQLGIPGGRMLTARALAALPEPQDQTKDGG